ncbi:hypothetical protein SLEP1_g7297 [Rubroshorea leprosula]|uniref:Protein kinase domain-containing protein n=1 Tax=Rubroshorea leprosula TaxID=152421 RepID=A0AAV5HXY3_9ROSI|nr:hypothetical protein SLEP1_g7297 [Rubroshorea leprosula]
MDRRIRKHRLRFLSWLRRSRPGPISFVKHYAYKDVKKATDGFNRVIYGNSHGAAYKARLEDGEVALVKEATVFNERKDFFYREVQFLERLHHRHLLPLRGFSTGHKRLLVFDNIQNGSLKEHLNDPLKTPLNWKTRLEIATGVAAALEYLLLFSNPPVYHVSINSSNIMFDENFTAKLSDVGLLSSVGNYVNVPHSSCSEECMGEECGSIIFQLGVLILELITGQSSEHGGPDLIQWVQGSRLGSSIHMMIDPDLGNNYDHSELKKLLAVARLCIKSKNNPTFPISQVLRYLQKKVVIAHD